MRQVVNGIKGGPLLGHTSCIIKSDEDESDRFHQQEQDVDNCEEQELDADDEGDHDQTLQPVTPKSKGPRLQIERERRVRREIANSNERRRMQSINQGYMSLKGMLPASEGGEKLSKAAVLQNAADYMAQILEERKQLLMRNAELTQAINAQRQQDDSSGHKRRKRDMTESSDEGISMSYHPVNQDAEVVEELRRTVTDLRVDLEREKQRSSLFEQSYTYSLMAAQAAAQQHLISSDSVSTDITHHHLPAAVTPLSPPQSRHGSTDEFPDGTASYPHSNPATSQDRYISGTERLPTTPSIHQEPQQTFGKASSVASQNLSIIVEAINHLEGDGDQPPHTEKEPDSGVSHGESSDDTKSEGSETPQPPPAHQPTSTAVLMPSSMGQHRPASSLLYPASTRQQGPTTPAVPLLYRPTFLSNYMSSQCSGTGALPTNYVAQRHPSL